MSTISEKNAQGSRQVTSSVKWHRGYYAQVDRLPRPHHSPHDLRCVYLTGPVQPCFEVVCCRKTVIANILRRRLSQPPEREVVGDSTRGSATCETVLARLDQLDSSPS